MTQKKIGVIYAFVLSLALALFKKTESHIVVLFMVAFDDYILILFYGIHPFPQPYKTFFVFLEVLVFVLESRIVFLRVKFLSLCFCPS